MPGLNVDVPSVRADKAGGSTEKRLVRCNETLHFTVWSQNFVFLIRAPTLGKKGCEIEVKSVSERAEKSSIGVTRPSL